MKTLTKGLTILALLITVLSCKEQLQKSAESVYIYKCKNAFTDKEVLVNYYIPNNYKKGEPIQIVMPGVKRNGDEYLKSWVEYAEKNKIIVISPSFSKEAFPLAAYQEGNVVDFIGNYINADNTIYPIIDEIYLDIKSKIDNKINGYNIFGHSAGGQFVHRFTIFHDSPYVKKAIAANPGWYTFLDSTIAYPYGIKNYSSEQREIKNAKDLYKKILSKDFTLLLGTADTLRTSDLRKTPEADEQGLTRLARGNKFFNNCKEFSQKNNLDFNWEIKYVEGVGHNQQEMGKAVQ